jgi:D-hexose-6-phosphate mutarotase
MIVHKVLADGYRYIEIKNSKAEAKIALQGGHIFHYKAKGAEPLLWLSNRAIFQKGKAIRGGVPICFPWFGPHPTDDTLPQHGFARTAMWKLVLEEELSEEESHIQLQLLSSSESKKMWNHEFDVRLDIRVGRTLSLSLMVTNIDTKPFTITAALHSYFNVSDISNVQIEGLDGSYYIDALTNKIDGFSGKLAIDKEVDRIYFDASSTIVLHDRPNSMVLNQSGSNSLVVWNPWIEKAKALIDMPDDGYRTMLCLETGNVSKDERIIKPEERHILSCEVFLHH